VAVASTASTRWYDCGDRVNSGWQRSIRHSLHRRPTRDASAGDSRRPARASTARRRRPVDDHHAQ
jgi:hypothetical protein